MGYGTFTTQDWNSYTTTRGITGQSTHTQIYRNTSMKDSLNPKGITYRESCDSDDHPNSTPVILAIDVTGSMGDLAATIAKESLKTLMEELYTKQPVPDPHVMFMAIGDAYTDYAPLQVSQFEADIRIAEQLTDIYFEGHGGGNGGESYLAAWYFAARHTKIDSFEKHNRKGFIFTIGDEPNHKVLTKDQIKEIFGDDVEADLTAEELLTEVTRQYEVFHLIVKDGERRYGSVKAWNKLLDERAMEVTDYTKIPEIVEATMEILNGKDVDTVSKQWDGTTNMVVQNAVKGLSVVDSSKELVEF